MRIAVQPPIIRTSPITVMPLPNNQPLVPARCRIRKSELSLELQHNSYVSLTIDGFHTTYLTYDWTKLRDCEEYKE